MGCNKQTGLKSKKENYQQQLDYKLPPFKRVCPVDGVIFFTSFPQQVYCSKKCRNKAAITRYWQKRLQKGGENSDKAVAK